ncbi:MAG: hypothetical protein AAFZ07_17070 [Actinomycetota bacterium]
MTWLADLRVPAATSALRTIRLLVGSVASTVDLTVDAIEDLQMAAAECAALVIEAAGADAVLALEVHDLGGAIEVRGSVETDAAAIEVDELALLVLSGTVDAHEVDPGPGARSFVVRKERRG